MKAVLILATAAMIALTSIDLASVAQKLAETALNDAQARIAENSVADSVGHIR